MIVYSCSAARASVDSKIEDVCKLLRSTDYSTAQAAKRVANYPENYFRQTRILYCFCLLCVIAGILFAQT